MSGGERHAGDPGATDRLARRRADRHHAGSTAAGRYVACAGPQCAAAARGRRCCSSTAPRTCGPGPDARDPDGGVTLSFNQHDDAFAAALQTAGRLGIAAVYRAPRRAEARGQPDYQTVFATHDGAVAAPTAGLHFTPDVARRTERRGIRARHRHAACRRRHIPAGAIRGRQRNITCMPNAARLVRRRRGCDQRGTAPAGASSRLAPPACACWRAAAIRRRHVHPFAGETSLFILPGYRFRAVDLLMTNFHLPRSTLFMLVCAFAGTERMRSRLCARDRCRLPLLLLRRCMLAVAP